MSNKVFQGICLMSTVVVLGACSLESAGLGNKGGLKKAPESVAELAAPNQNLDAVRIDPEEGCYWYLYDGPVETTFLPLRSKNGSRICIRSSAIEA